MGNEPIQIVSVGAKHDYTKALQTAQRSGIPLIVTVIDDFPSKNGVVCTVLNGLRERFSGCGVMLVTMPLANPDGIDIGFSKVKAEIPSVHFEDTAGRSLTDGPLEGDEALNPKRIAFVAGQAYSVAARRASACNKL